MKLNKNIQNFIFKLFIVSFLTTTPRCANILKQRVTSSSYHIYLSHIRKSNNTGVYKKIYELNFNLYETILLGGDLGANTFKGDFINHIDSIFDLKNKNTLWSIGNHDITSDDNFKKYTTKNKFHAYKKRNTTFITLDSQDSLSFIVGKQKKFLFNIIQNTTSKNIVILSHKLIFMDQHPIMDEQINQVCNGPKGKCSYCHNTNNFKNEIYPQLTKVKKEGKNIIWIGGDLGYKTSSYEYKDLNGIIFLGNGIWHKKNKNKVLILLEQEKKIQHKFVYIDSLLKNQNKEYIHRLFLN